MSAKERALRVIEQLPDDVDYDQLTQKLDFIRAVDEGLEQSAAKRTLSAQEVRRRLSQWLSE